MNALKLNLGCFDRAIDGWINTDITPHIFIAKVPLVALALRRLGRITEERYQQHRAGIFDTLRYLDLGRPFPLRDNTVDYCFSAHVLEHLYREQAIRCVREVYRVLKPGGVFRVTVPDLDLAVAKYDSQDPDVLLKLVYESDQPRDKNRHHWMYNAHSMGRLLRSAGFALVERCAYRQGRCPDLDRLDNRPDVSLFMEGVK